MQIRPRSALLAAGFGLLIGCAAYQAQHAGSTRAEAPGDAPAAAAAPAAFRAQDGRAQLAEVKGELDHLKHELHARGQYDCCVEPACNECLLRDGECHCREVIESEGPCCGECTGAWVAGRGAVEGIQAWEVLERKKELVNRPASAGAGEGAAAADGVGQPMNDGAAATGGEPHPHRH